MKLQTMQTVRNSRKLLKPTFQLRNSSNIEIKKNADIAPALVNRNPRNLERLRIAYKPDGYHVDKPGKSYWHKLNITVTGRYATATVNHFENGEVLRASTSEWCIKKQLYKTKDTSAFVNLGRVLGLRCLQSGLTEIRCDIEPPNKDGKIALFLKAVEESGVQLKEPPQLKPAYPWDQTRPEKPWEVEE